MPRLAAFAAACLALFALYFLGFRPEMMRWGATDAEVAEALPGDTQWPEATQVETRAITIAGPPTRVWPWLAQLGQDRGGFYSYEWLENLVGAEIRNADRLLPGLPERCVGDTLWMAPRRRFQGSGFAIFSWVEPGRALVVSTHVGRDPTQVGTWAFVLEPRGPGETRFIVRGRSGQRGSAPPLSQRVFEQLVFEPMHFVMERRMLLGLKQRAEGAPPDPRRDAAEAACWIVALLVAVVAAIAMLLRTAWVRAWALFVGAGLSLLVLPLERPPLALTLAAAAVLLAATPWAVWWGGRAPRQ
jgi:hypothetical protein